MRKPRRFISIATISFLAAASLLCGALVSAQQSDNNPRAWMNDVRIGAYGLTSQMPLRSSKKRPAAACMELKSTMTSLVGMRASSTLPPSCRRFNRSQSSLTNMAITPLSTLQGSSASLPTRQILRTDGEGSSDMVAAQSIWRTSHVHRQRSVLDKERR